MASAPIILVPGFWLGAWAWDDGRRLLRADGHDVTAITLPGLESKDADRSNDHVRGPRRRDHRRGRGGRSAGRARRPQRHRVHRLRGERPRPGSDRRDGLRRHRAREGRRRTPSSKGDKPFVWADIEKEENLDGLSEEQKATFRERAVPVPGGVLRDGTSSRTTPDGTSRARSSRPASPPTTTRSTRRSTRTGRSSRAPGAAQRHLDRPADEPLADVVEPEEIAKIIGDVATKAGGVGR